jgi:predicted Fe-Mo cluster-binding NifX family protein
LQLYRNGGGRSRHRQKATGASISLDLERLGDDGTPRALSKVDEEDHAMKVALTVWDGRISPVFDVSREALILTVESGAVLERRSEGLERPTEALRIARLLELGVETLVCGAISEPLCHELTAKGVRVIGFVAGEIDKVVETLLADALPAPAFSQPGCGGGRNRFREGRGRGGRRGGGRGRGRNKRS